MNYQEKVSNILKDPRPAASLILLLAVIIFLISRCSPEPTIRLNPKGFANGIVINFGYTLDGQILVTSPDGKVLRRVKSNNPHGEFLKALSSISIAAVAGGDSKVASASKENGFLEMIIPNAQAYHYMNLNHDYYVNYTIDGVPGCIKYDISNYPPTAIPTDC